MKLETNPKTLQRQQIILAHLGYYRGKLDGIWGPETIKAKQDFETSGKFAPGLPNRGLPFVNTNSLPKGMFADPFNKGLLSVRGLGEDEIKQMLKDKGEHTGNAVAKNIEQPIIEKQEESAREVTNVEAPAPADEALTKESIDSKPAEHSSEKPVEKPAQQNAQSNKQKKNPNQNSRHRHHN